MTELVLITGSTGLLGFRVLVEILQSGYRVRAAVRNRDKYEKIQSHPLVVPYQDQLEAVVVPDITVDGAYDEAVRGVDKILHIASPVPNASITDYEAELIEPAVRGTVGMLESATKASTVRRVVITASIGSIIPGTELMSGSSVVYNEKSQCPPPPKAFDNPLAAYLGSKAIAFQATVDFMTNRAPSYDLINILPGYIVGRNDLVTDVKDLFLGTNRLVLGQLLGQASPNGIASTSAHINDVARAHAISLDSRIPGNQNFVISSDGPKGTTWADALDIVSTHYSQEVIRSAGFKLNGNRTPTHRILIDSDYSQKTLGIHFRTFQEQVLSIAGQYLELSGIEEIERTA